MELNINDKNQATMSANDIATLVSKGIGEKQVRVSHILVKDEKLAKEIFDEITAADSQKAAFAALAMKESSCPSKQNGGDLGWFGKGQMVPEFDAAVFSMLIGEIKHDVKTQFGIHLIYKEDERLFLPIQTA